MDKSNKHIFFLNFISLFSVKGFDLVITLGLIPYFIVKVGTANYGNYAFIMALMMFFVNILNYGFDLSAVRSIASNRNNDDKMNSVFNEVFSVKLFLIIVLYVIAILLLLIVPRFWKEKELFIFGSLVLIGDFFSLRWFFVGIEKMKFITVISFISNVIFVGLVLLLVKKKSDYILIPLAEAIGMFIVSGLFFIWVIRDHKINIKLLSLKEVVVYLRTNISSLVNLLLPSTTSILIVFLVGIFGIPYEVALTQVGVKISNAFSTVNTVLSTIFYSMINREAGKMMHTRYILLGIGFFLSMVMYFGSSFLIRNWLKLESDSHINYTVQIVQILSPIPFLMGMISCYGINGLLVFHKDKLYSSITLGTSLFIVVFGFFSITKFAILGGAITLVSGRMLYAFLSFYFYKTKIGFNQ